MYNQKQLIDVYNRISDEKLDKEKLSKIAPKLYLIMNKLELDDIEIVRTIDTLIEIDNLNYLDNITPEVIDLIIRTKKNEKIKLEWTLYFSIILKHFILPYNQNKCDCEYDIILYLSEFEVLLDLANTMFNKKDLVILDKYNHELKETFIKYKQVKRFYDSCVIKKNYATETLYFMLLHFVSLFYFNLDQYEHNYELIDELLVNIINNFEDFMNYYHSNVTSNKYDSIIEREYIVGKEMLDYIYNSKKEEKKKRK